MSAIKQLKQEDGFGMLNTLIVVMFFGMMGTSLVVLLTSDSRMQAINTERSRAFYSAHSGIEYCIRGICESASRSVGLGILHNYHETLDTGEGTRCEVSIRLLGGDSLEITSTGFTNLAVHTLKKALNYIKKESAPYALVVKKNVFDKSQQKTIFLRDNNNYKILNLREEEHLCK